MPTLEWRNRDEATTAASRVPVRALIEIPELGCTSLAEAQSCGGKCCQCDNVASANSQLPVKPQGPLETGNNGTGNTSTLATFENLLVHGDNLAALKALLPFAAGRVKCIYIDPPYNTGSAFEHYDDNLEHSTWLSLLYPRLELLREFLSEDGSIWVSLDDNEVHYCKVIMDEIYGRQNFLVDVIWQHSVQPKGYLDKFSIHHNHILLYRKSLNFKLNPLERETKDNKSYSNPDNDPKGLWRSGDVRNALYRPNLIYDIITPSGKIIKPCKNGWRWSKETMNDKIRTGEIVFSKDETRIIHKIYLATVRGRAPESIFFGEYVGTTREAMEENKALFGLGAFATPKPERLVKRILEIATNPGDLVMDSFLGSGTTAAVAHKMGRRWIGVELGEHARTHCAVRMRKVIEGEQGGVSKAVGWKGGGSFRFLELGGEIFDADGTVRADVPWEVLAAHIWFTETKTGWRLAAAPQPQAEMQNVECRMQNASPVLGIHGGVAYALLYNGVLKDRRVDGGNVLTRRTLALIREDLRGATAMRNAECRMENKGAYDRLVVFAEWSRLGPETLAAERIEFRQTPYDLKGAR